MHNYVIYQIAEDGTKTRSLKSCSLDGRDIELEGCSNVAAFALSFLEYTPFILRVNNGKLKIDFDPDNYPVWMKELGINPKHWLNVAKCFIDERLNKTDSLQVYLWDEGEDEGWDSDAVFLTRG